MINSTTIDVALFPIPGMVTFPGTVAPLHVFEPRYRSMIKYCLENNTMLAVSHTRKTKKSKASNALKKPTPNVIDMNSNLPSHESHDVFSAGNCELVETTDDGRMHVNVHFKHRLRRIKTLQQVPFETVHCELFEDTDSSLDKQGLEELVVELQQLVLLVSKQANSVLYDLLRQSSWQSLSPAAFSYQLFNYFKFEADFMQTVLEQNQVEQRLKLIWQGLSQAV